MNNLLEAELYIKFDGLNLCMGMKNISLAGNGRVPPKCTPWILTLFSFFRQRSSWWRKCEREVCVFQCFLDPTPDTFQPAVSIITPNTQHFKQHSTSDTSDLHLTLNTHGDTRHSTSGGK